MRQDGGSATVDGQGRGPRLPRTGPRSARAPGQPAAPPTAPGSADFGWGRRGTPGVTDRGGRGDIPPGWPVEAAAHAAWALRQAEVRRWPAGATLFSSHPRGGGLFWLRRGAVRLAVPNASGEPVLVAVVAAPALTGDPGPVFGRASAPLTATCITACEAAYWPYPQFRAMLAQRPELAVLLAYQGMETFHQAAQRVTGLLSPHSRLRVLHVLVLLARTFPLPDGSRSRLPASLTQQAIGLAANAGRVTVNRVLADLRRRGIVGRTRPLYIRSPERLQALLVEEEAAASREGADSG
ncbi:MAG TPA: Crp/Fnr family transcriptional regulator [Thermaerobacter sp.]